MIQRLPNPKIYTQMRRFPSTILRTIASSCFFVGHTLVGLAVCEQKHGFQCIFFHFLFLPPKVAKGWGGANGPGASGSVDTCEGQREETVIGNRTVSVGLPISAQNHSTRHMGLKLWVIIITQTLITALLVFFLSHIIEELLYHLAFLRGSGP